ncbi:2-amino-4-hydroxy-6-hydroxymethyldihydropteridine diphosphokinase [Epilithonimonas sp.]|uniref:2-amino-4-hydroxy-6- hydroxymethyldihydropteridine diphosphokinase n=1 Tax=Epilithonimonas sp. TaxID=2894511 RepID=UPI00289B5CE9|nr:2-amino-4-hydroxy-6-hydroxymethyldihydropteridine diphosphokinase [Epilithonimonas sp.]
MSHNSVVLLLGSNINNPENNIQIALKKIEENIGSILKKSELITSEPVGFDSENNFCNITIKLKTQFSPITLLRELKYIERVMGRVKDSSYFDTYQDRIIDIDIILYNNVKFISKRLVIPHYKNLYERDFARDLINDVK